MKDEAQIWLTYAEENLQSAEVLLQNSLFNPCLQNAQQSIEKACKALLAENNVLIKRTHDIYELKLLLNKNNLYINITAEECDLMNSIYLPSKYPLGSALPHFMPDLGVCKNVLEIARRVFNDIEKQLK